MHLTVYRTLSHVLYQLPLIVILRGTHYSFCSTDVVTRVESMWLSLDPTASTGLRSGLRWYGNITKVSEMIVIPWKVLVSCWLKKKSGKQYRFIFESLSINFLCCYLFVLLSFFFFFFAFPIESYFSSQASEACQN